MVNSLISDSQLDLRPLPLPSDLPKTEGKWFSPTDGMTTWDRPSSGPLPEGDDLPTHAEHWDRCVRFERTLTGCSSREAGLQHPAELWIEGGVLMCACPDCHAPMTVRLWLLIADCWQCGTSIELSERQQRAAQRLLEGQSSGSPSPPASRSPVAAASASARPVAAAPPTRAARAPALEPQPVRPQPPVASPSPRPSRNVPPPPARSSPELLPEVPSEAPSSSPPANSPAPPPEAFRRRRVTAAETLARRRLEAYAPSHWVSHVWDETPAWLVSLGEGNGDSQLFKSE